MKAWIMLAVASAVFTASAAEAKIVCKDDFQKVGGSYISTPYCRDNYLARIAREYGVKASDVAVRQNPNFKKEICRLIGRDIRVRDNCEPLESQRGRF